MLFSLLNSWVCTIHLPQECSKIQTVSDKNPHTRKRTSQLYQPIGQLPFQLDFQKKISEKVMYLTVTNNLNANGILLSVQFGLGPVH